jgi:hypothetical protein
MTSAQARPDRVQRQQQPAGRQRQAALRWQLRPWPQPPSLPLAVAAAAAVTVIIVCSAAARWLGSKIPNQPDSWLRWAATLGPESFANSGASESWQRLVPEVQFSSSTWTQWSSELTRSQSSARDGHIMVMNVHRSTMASQSWLSTRTDSESLTDLESNVDCDSLGLIVESMTWSTWTMAAAAASARRRPGVRLGATGSHHDHCSGTELACTPPAAGRGCTFKLTLSGLGIQLSWFASGTHWQAASAGESTTVTGPGNRPAPTVPGSDSLRLRQSSQGPPASRRRPSLSRRLPGWLPTRPDAARPTACRAAAQDQHQQIRVWLFDNCWNYLKSANFFVLIR